MIDTTSYCNPLQILYLQMVEKFMSSYVFLLATDLFILL